MGRKTIVAVTLVLILFSSGLMAATHSNTATKTGTNHSKATFKPSTATYYPIRLVEHGLPKYWYWYAEIGPANGTNYSSYSPTDAPTMTYYEPPGNYSLEVWANGYNYESQNLTYSANVVNSLVIVNISFIEQFNISVFEKGLPNGTSWEINMIANSQYSPSYGASTPPFRNNLSVWVPNGTYELQVGQMRNYGLTPFHFTTNVKVNGSNLNYTVTFNRVNITETGLENNTSWGT